MYGRGSKGFCPGKGFAAAVSVDNGSFVVGSFFVIELYKRSQARGCHDAFVSFFLGW